MAASRKQKSPTKPRPQFKEEDETKKGAVPRPDEMSAEVIEFMTAMDHYKRVNRRPFPTWSEVLEVLKTLGYQRAR